MAMEVWGVSSCLYIVYIWRWKYEEIQVDYIFWNLILIIITWNNIPNQVFGKN